MCDLRRIAAAFCTIAPRPPSAYVVFEDEDDETADGNSDRPRDGQRGGATAAVTRAVAGDVAFRRDVGGIRGRFGISEGSDRRSDRRGRSEEGNTAKLNETRTRLQETWNAVRPALVAKGGTTEATQFDALVAQLTKAKTAKDFTATAKPILDNVDLLENVFTRA